MFYSILSVRRIGLFIGCMVGLTVLNPGEVHARAPFVAGMSAELGQPLQGKLMLTELNCIACHQTSLVAKEESKSAPRLSRVADRLNPYYLQQYISAPRTTKQGTTMPDVLHALPTQDRAEVAKSMSKESFERMCSMVFPHALPSASQSKVKRHARWL